MREGYMRRRRSPRSTPRSSMISDLDESQRFMKKKLGIYLDRILGHESKLYREILAMLCWLVGPETLKDGVEEIASLVVGPQRRDFERQFRKVFEPDNFSHAVLALVKGGGWDL